MLNFFAENHRLIVPSVFLNRLGLFSASWRPAKNKLASLVFQPEGDVSWLVFVPSGPVPDEIEEAAGRCAQSEVVYRLRKFGATDWMLRPGLLSKLSRFLGRD